MTETIKAGVIGLGAMGAPMARHLVEAGFLSMVWNRNTEKSAQFAARYRCHRCRLARTTGGWLQCDPGMCLGRCGPAGCHRAAVAGGYNPAVSCVTSPRWPRPPPDRLPRAWLRPAPALSMHRCPVAWKAPGKAVCRSWREVIPPIFRRLCQCWRRFPRSVTHMGPVGSGQATKAVNQVMVAGIAEATCEALALAEKLNLPSQRLLSVVSAGAAGSWFLDHRGQSMLENQFDIGFKLSLLLKDLLICRSLAQDLNIDYTDS